MEKLSSISVQTCITLNGANLAEPKNRIRFITDPLVTQNVGICNRIDGAVN